jgi:hypothetical protein
MRCVDAILQVTTNWNEDFAVSTEVEAGNFTKPEHSV